MLRNAISLRARGGNEAQLGPSERKTVSRRRAVLSYVGMLALAGGAFALVRQVGSSLVAPHAEALAEGARAGSGGFRIVLSQALVALLVVVASAKVLGRVVRMVGQPAVIGEIVAGILLGPTFFLRLAPKLHALVFPAPAIAGLELLAQVGVVFFMFVVGLELDTKLLSAKKGATLAISHASIVLPFTLGAALALYLYPRFSSDRIRFDVFAIFMGVAMSITAFPVLARILTEKKLLRTELGVMALSCAAADDFTAWCLVAVLVGLGRSEGAGALRTMGASVTFLAVVLTVVRPLVTRFVSRWDDEAKVGPETLGAGVVALLLSALTTEAIGLHAIFGAFLLGAIVPHESAFARRFAARFDGFVSVLLLPAFFAFTGLRARIDLVSGAATWGITIAIILVACLGKFGGSALAARAVGVSWRDAAAIGALMNTRGLMELVVLNLGLDLGVISPLIFAMMVIMALVTTAMTAPALSWVLGSSKPSEAEPLKRPA